MADDTGTLSTPATPTPDDVNTFNSYLNTNWHAADYDSRLGIARTIVGGSIATVADFGASVWNSLPMTPDVQTQDLLSRVSNDALQVYNEDPDAVHMASFVGGSLVPFGLATKGMGLARAGVKGANWFSEAGKVESMANLGRIFAESGPASTEYTSALRGVYARGMVNQALDAAAGEFAVTSMMHAHPLMEDYMQDPVKNFALGIGLGSVVGGAIGHIADRYTVRGAMGAIESRELGKSVGLLRDINPDMTGAVALQSHDVNIQNLSTMIDMEKAAGKDSTNSMAVRFAEQVRINETLKQKQVFEAMVGQDPVLKAMSVPDQQEFMRVIAAKREMIGVDDISTFRVGQGTKDPMKLPGVEVTIPGATSEIKINPNDLKDIKVKHGIQDELFNMPNNMMNTPLAEAMKLATGNTPLNPTALDYARGIANAQKAGREDIVNQIIYQAHGDAAIAGVLGETQASKELTDLVEKHTTKTVQAPDTVVKSKGVSPPLTDKPTLTRDKIDKKTGQTVKKDIESVYYAEWDRYGQARDVVNYGNATVLNKTVAELEAALPKNYSKVPNLDSSLEMISKSAPTLHGEYIAARARVEKWTAKDFANAVLGENDLPLMSAMYQKLNSDFNLAKDVKIQLGSKKPLYEAIMNQPAATAGLNKAGLPQTLADAYHDFTSPGARGIEQFDPKSFGNVSKHAKDLLHEWLAGDQRLLNLAALSWSAKGFSAIKGDIQDLDRLIKSGYGSAAIQKIATRNTQLEGKAAFEEIYNSPESQALRAKFLALADADGFVPLYRGQGQKSLDIRRQNILQSFTTDPVKAEEFTSRYGMPEGHGGDVRLQKVHVDNIVAGWGDLKSHDGLKKNEILVIAGERPIDATLDTAQKATFLRKQQDPLNFSVAANNKTAAFGDLKDMLIAEKQRQMDEMFARGVPPETISLKTDTPLETVLSYGAGKNGGAVSLAEMIGDDVTPLVKTATVKDAEEALSAKNTPLRLKGNQKKNNNYGEGHAALDQKSMGDINKTATMAIMASSKNQTALEMNNFLNVEMKNALDIAKQQLYLANNQLAGIKFLNSSDFFARNMKDLGPVFDNIGRQIQRMSNDQINRVVKPISDAMQLITKDATGASTVEFNTFFNVNNSLKGWRKFMPDGTLVQKEMATDALGKQVQILKPVTLNGQPYRVATKEVQDAIMAMQGQGGELLSLRNAGRKIKGQADTSDLGLYIPSFNPVGKFIAYVHDIRDDTTRMIWANNENHYKDSIKAYQEFINSKGISDQVKIHEKGAAQSKWSWLNGRLDTINMERADVGMQKMGSNSSALVRTDANVFTEITGGYEHYINSEVRNLAELNMHEITGMLDNMSAINRGSFYDQPLGKVQSVVKAPKDAALTMKNTLLGNSNLGEYAGWKSINQGFETLLSFGIDSVNSIWKTATEALPSFKAPTTFTNKAGEKFIGAEAMKQMDYEKLTTEMAKQGIVNPFAVFDKDAAKMFGLASIQDSKDTSKRIVHASNALVATMALRFGELAQPLVNMLSLPILTGLAINSKLPAEFLGAKLGTANLGPLGGVQLMYEGVRAMNSPQYRGLSKQWEAAGHFTPLVSEASDVMRLSRSFEKGAIPTIENALDSNVVKIMSKPADYSESIVRKLTMHTGAVLAKRLYPELDDVGITIFARDFMDKAVGNFSASQKPVMFQGTMGTALGLFQTYMLTLGQSIYRQLEMRNYKALGKAALTQSTLFGIESMPGFAPISQAIGEHFSDDHVDLTTGTYRAIGDKAANFVLYGLPSNIGPALYSRGDVSIRPPNVLGGLQNTVAVSAASQTLDMLSSFKDAMGADDASLGRAFGQALSMQSISRPLARGAELMTGYSVTKKGNTIQVPEEVWTTTGIMSRVLGTRPLEEAKLREAMHLNTYYGSLDRDNREKLLEGLRTSIRGGEVNDDYLAKISNEYLRKGGTPTGWRSAYAKAIAHTEEDGKGPLLEKLGPRSPLNFMINNLD